MQLCEGLGSIHIRNIECAREPIRCPVEIGRD